MFFFILQTLFLALLAFIIGYFLGRFLKSIFCKKSASTDSYKASNTKINTSTSTPKNKTSKLNKTAVVATAGAGAAAVAQALSDKETSIVASSPSDKRDDSPININDETSKTKVENNEILEDTITKVEVAEVVSNSQEDNSLLNAEKITVATIATESVAKVGANILDNKPTEVAEIESIKSSTIIDETIVSVEPEDIGSPTDITSENNELDETIYSGINKADNSNPLENPTKSKVTEEIETTSNNLSENRRLASENNIDEAESVKEEAQTTGLSEDQESSDNNNDESGLLDTLKTAATIAGAGIIAKTNASVLSGDKNEGLSTSDSSSDGNNAINKGIEIEEIEGIGKGYGRRLRAMGIHTTIDLFNKCSSDRGYEKKIAQKMTLNEKAVNSWYQMADLMRIETVNGQIAELLFFSGITSTQELSIQDASKLISKVERTNEAQHRMKETPAKEMIPLWIASAKLLCK